MRVLSKYAYLLFISSLYLVGCGPSHMMLESDVEQPRLNSLNVVWNQNSSSNDSSITAVNVYPGDGFTIEDSGSLRIIKKDFDDPDIELTINVYPERLSTDNSENVNITPHFLITNGYNIKPSLIESSLGRALLDQQYIQIVAERGDEIFEMFIKFRGKSELMTVKYKKNKKKNEEVIQTLYNPPGNYIIESGGSIKIHPTDVLPPPIDLNISLSNDRSLSKGYTTVPNTRLFDDIDSGFEITPQKIEEVTEKDLYPNSYIIIKADRGGTEPFHIFLQYKKDFSWSGISAPALLRLDGSVTGWFELQNLAPSIATGIQRNIDNRKFSYIAANVLLSVFQKQESNEYSLAIGPAFDFSSYFQLGYSYHIADKNWFFTFGIRPESLLSKLFPSVSIAN